MSIYINLNDEEEKLLEEAAREDRRTPQQQAAWLVVSTLRQRKAFESLNAKMQEQFNEPSDYDYAQATAIPVRAGAIHAEEPD